MGGGPLGASELVSDVLFPAVRLGTVLAFLALAVAAGMRVRRANPAERWVGAAFGTIGGALLLLTVDDLVGAAWPDWLTALGLIGIVAFPWLLLRFTATFEPLPGWVEVVVASTGLAGAVLVASAVVDGESLTTVSAGAGVALTLTYWLVASGVTVSRLWRAGRGQPTVTRRSMHLMSAGSAVLAAALLLVATLAEAFPLTSLFAHLLALGSAMAFGAGYAPSRALRRAWRAPEEEQLLAATVKVLRAETAEDAYRALLGPTVRMVAGTGAAIVDETGQAVATHGVMPELDDDGAVQHLQSVPLGPGYGSLVVGTGPYSRFFGRDDRDLLKVMAVIASVALERCDLLDEERRQHDALRAAREDAERARLDAERAREEAERAKEEAERAREEADRANLAKSEFLSRMSHELRTPLNAVLGFGQLLEESALSQDDTEMVEHIVKAGRHLLDLINDVLDLSRIEAGSMTISVEPVHVGELVRDTVALVRPMAADRQIALQSDAEDCDEFVRTDRQRARQVLLNLLSNAIKYNHDGGRVEVTCAMEGGFVRVAVTDTGPGIDPAHRDQLFEPFQRLGAESSGVEGTGLGLALSRNLAERLGGGMDVESTPGVGSTFWIDLPLTETPDVGDVAERQEVDHRAPASGQRRTLLLVEDNLANLRVVEAVVKRRRPDIEVLPVMQGTLAVDLALEHQPDMILLDLHLPDLPGQQVLQRLKADPRTRDIPVVIASADATPGRQRRLRDLGAHDYLAKPYQVSQFLEVVDEAMNGRDPTGDGAGPQSAPER
jgi:signal transduction histidine kinase/ActR/RegA family two-component response regulator